MENEFTDDCATIRTGNVGNDRNLFSDVTFFIASWITGNVWKNVQAYHLKKYQ